MQAIKHDQSLQQNEVESSHRLRNLINRERDLAEARLMADYFGKGKEAAAAARVHLRFYFFSAPSQTVPKFEEITVVSDYVSNSGLWDQLNSWANQYKADSEYWGIGSNPIFTVFQDSSGKIDKVEVNEDEIALRTPVDPFINDANEVENVKVLEKIRYAKVLAKEMEIGKNVVSPNSSVVKYVTFDKESGLINSVRSFVGKPGFVPKVTKVGVSVFCGVIVVLVIKAFLGEGNGDKEEFTSLEKEMLRRKMKARTVKKKSVKGSVEVVHDFKEVETVFSERPRVDKDELMNSIVKVKELNDHSIEFDGKIQEIRAMARHAREIEKIEGKKRSEEDNDGLNDEVNGKEVNAIVPKSFDVSQGDDVSRNSSELSGNESNVEDNESINNEAGENEVNCIDSASLGVPQSDTHRVVNEMSCDNNNVGNSDVLRLEVTHNDESVAQDGEDEMSNLLDTEKPLEKESVRPKLRIISSVKEAREFLQKKKLDKKEETEEAQVSYFDEVPDTISNREMFEFSNGSTLSNNKSPRDTNVGDKGNVLTKNGDAKDQKEKSVKSSDAKAGELERANREKWTEDNFHEFEPMVEKIRSGFRNNYMVAKEKVKEDLNLVSELKMLERGENESELEWMKDEKLREIVFQVRENELMGREPFYLMDAEDKALFFKGLENKVEKVNEELRDLHEYLHSNIENLDYGADGISLYDSPEKIIPRWKGPQPATTMSQESLDDYLDQRKALFAETLGNSDLVKRDPQSSVQSTNEKVENKNLKSPKTVIEGSDGSIKPGKKSGKEFWQHTKKWSRGFIDSYNAENDPETKAVMKDIGKDLDRWITEKEIQDAADVMNKVPEKGKKFIAEKINKLKREMELFGPQAVVSKYSEYGDEEEIDYYWWLDLPFLLVYMLLELIPNSEKDHRLSFLPKHKKNHTSMGGWPDGGWGKCIELYIDGDGDGDQRIGFYSLEMAADLELDPKPHHIIAFEDAGDCKNFCYIMNAHMEMLGNGNTFIVPQTPKDTYQEARANGFNVTVIRKGELKLDVDQTLEEVEEKIDEIGSKMYHDKIMKGRNVNVDSVMKGVFGLKKPTQR
ncbi:hypothetical protein Tco_1459024 [Tanacetum coccineum]